MYCKAFAITTGAAEKPHCAQRGKKYQHKLLESLRKVDGKDAREEMAKEHGRIAITNVEKAETKRKVKERETKASVSTNSEILQKNSGQVELWEQWSEQPWQSEANSTEWQEANKRSGHGGYTE